MIPHTPESPSSVLRLPLSHGLKSTVSGLLLLLLTLTIAPFAPTPSSDPLEAYDADASLALLLGHAHQNQLQFGVDHILTYGPLGFLIFPVFSPYAAGAHMLTAFLLALIVAAGLCLLAARLGPPRAFLLLAGFLWALTNSLAPIDLLLNAGFLAWGFLAFLEPGAPRTLHTALLVAVAAFTALAKTSFLLIATLTILLLAADLILRRQTRPALLLLLAFVALYLSGWLLAGQQLRHLPAFLLNSFHIISAYNHALGWEPLQTAGQLGLILFLLVAALLITRTLLAFNHPEPPAPQPQPRTGNRTRARARRLLLLAWLSLLLFAAWKHGFVRAQPAYVTKFLGFLSLVPLALILLPCPHSAARLWTNRLALLAWVLPLITLQSLFAQPLPTSLARPFHALSANTAAILDPTGAISKLQAALEHNRRKAELPQIRALVGNQTVGVFGRSQSYAFFNDLNFQPFPVPQSYAACSPPLANLNQQFQLTHRAPAFVLFELRPLDRKFPALEDSAALLQLFLNYRPVAFEPPFILLQKFAAEPARLTLLQKGTVAPGQRIHLTNHSASSLWLQIDLQPSWLGRLRQLLLRPPPVRLAAWDSSRDNLLLRARSPASMLRAGFLASPLLSKTEDLLSLHAHQPLPRPGAYSVELLPEHQRFCQQQIRYRLYRLDLPLANPANPNPNLDASKLLTAWQSAAEPQPSNTPLRLFRSQRWHPTTPPPGNPAETLVLLLFLAAPLTIAALLLTLRRHLKSIRLSTLSTSGPQPSTLSTTPAPAPSTINHQPSTVPITTLLLGNTLVFLGLASLALLAGELYFRFLYDTTDSLGYLRVSQRWVQRHWHLNNAGCRDNIDYQPHIPPGTRRLTFLGDSFTAGHGIPDVNDRFPNLLRPALPQTQIHVLANVGLDTGSQIVLLNRALKQGYQLDHVVLVYCLNDLNDLLPPDTVTDANLGRFSRSWLVQNSYLINFLHYRLRAARNPALKNYFPQLLQAYRGPAWQQQQQRLQALRDLVHQNGGRLSVVTFPFLHNLGPNYPYQFVHDQLDQFWRDLNVPHLDLLPIYRHLDPAQLTVNPFDAHPNQHASQLAAQALLPFLRF